MTSVLDSILAWGSSLGLTRAQSSAVAGNWFIESGLNPSAANAKEGAIGLGQWEGGRRTALQQFARSRGTSETDLATQLDFARSELMGPENGAYAALRAASTPAAAAAAFDQQYERSAGTSRSQRVSAANDIYNGVALPTSAAKGSSGGFLGSLSPWDFLVPGYGIAHAGGAIASGVASSWAQDAMVIGIKIVLTGAAAGLCVAGVMHTVKDG